jgi:cytochrome bd-type quinol oxidase subunit 2
MTRFGFFVFNLLLLTLLYGNVYLNGGKPGALSYTLREFSEPYIALILVMCILGTLRWFMSHDPEIAKEIVTWANALWLVPLLTLLALYLIRPADSHFWLDLRALMAIPKT